MDAHSIEKQIQNIRSLLQGTYSSMSNFRSSLIPVPDASFTTAGRLIMQEQYDIVVCGEVKKGKSSFINALMGEEVLPTNTQVATSQVCRIINSEKEEYNLVFTDGKRQPITKAELSKYGSQVDADLYGEPIFREHQLDYIEVKHPIPALPKFVALVDTPGIGAVYAAHEQITRNYLKKAAAVIFIIDPKNPIVAQEKAFIESALKITKRVMFVMTKMDNYDENVIATMISRDEDILAPLASQTATKKIVILPVSSTILFDATKEKDDLLLEMSCFDSIKEALLSMIYSTVGFDINASVFNALNHYNSKVVQCLDELQKSTTRPSAAKDLVEQKHQKQQEFVKDWGPNGTKVMAINEKVKLQLRGLENEVRTLFSQTHPIYKNMLDEIDKLSTKADAELLSKNMGGRLADSYGKAWKDIVERCENEIESILIECNAHMSVTEQNSELQIESFVPKQRSFADSLISGRNSYFTGAFVATLFSLPFTIFAAPITGAILGLFVGIAAAIVSKKDADMKQWKQLLKEHLSKCYMQIHDDFLVKPVSGKLTRLQSAEEEIQHFASDAMQKLTALHKENLDKQTALLEERAQADAAKRKILSAECAQVLQQWKPIHDNINKAKTILVQIEQAIE